NCFTFDTIGRMAPRSCPKIPGVCAALLFLALAGCVLDIGGTKHGWQWVYSFDGRASNLEGLGEEYEDTGSVMLFGGTDVRTINGTDDRLVLEASAGNS